MSSRQLPFPIALGVYGLLALLAGVTLEDWRFRAGVWLLLGALALKTWIAQRVPR